MTELPLNERKRALLEFTGNTFKLSLSEIESNTTGRTGERPARVSGRDRTLAEPRRVFSFQEDLSVLIGPLTSDFLRSKAFVYKREGPSAPMHHVIAPDDQCGSLCDPVRRWKPPIQRKR